MVNPLTIRESLLQQHIDDTVRCGVCERGCLISLGSRGWCQTRENRAGKLMTLIYGAVSSLSANPIEKKPFYHFYPGTKALTAGSWSCNFGCPWCQNWEISQRLMSSNGTYLSPKQLVELTRQQGCQGTSISFNEPTMALEWSLDVFRLARQQGFYNTFVSNGYMTAAALSLLIEAGLNAMNVDIKGDAITVRRYCEGINLEKVWANCRTARSSGLHLEITTLVIPGVNDARTVLQGIARRIVADLSTNVPWHLTRYYPAYRFEAQATSIQTLEKAWQIGKEAGLEFVYIGNVPPHPLSHTLCPRCNAMLIERSGFDVILNRVSTGHCPDCGYLIPGVWGDS